MTVVTDFVDMVTEPLLDVANLRVSFADDEVVHGVSFTVWPGECLAIVGESGSGKSVTARTLIGLTGAKATVNADVLDFRATSMLSYRTRDWQRLRGNDIGFVLQDALVSLDQLRPVGKEIAEAITAHRRVERDELDQRVFDLLRLVGVPNPQMRAEQRPDELSGGLRQRALIATALAGDPPLVIADEPTTALDATVAAQVLDVLAEAKTRGKALILISHDLAVVSRLADRVAVMCAGEFVESGHVADVLGDPQREYTRTLLNAIPSGASKGLLLTDRSPAPQRRQPDPDRPPALRARSLRKIFTGGGWATFGGGDDHSAAGVIGVENVEFELPAGGSLGIVGESGSGKTTTARMVLGLLPPDTGSVELNGSPWSTLSPAAKRLRRSEIAAIYQDPSSSFDPRWSVERILRDAVEAAGEPGAGRDARIAELLDQVHLPDNVRRRSPLLLSGGQRQRVAIARALATRPSVIVCDEPVSALDVSIQARVLDLLLTLQAETGVALLFISHDLGVIHHVCDGVLVMQGGVVVEHGPVDRIFERPGHPYTQRLLDSLPVLNTAAAVAV